LIDLAGNRVHERCCVSNIRSVSLNLVKRAFGSQSIDLLVAVVKGRYNSAAKLKLLLEQETLLIHFRKVAIQAANIERVEEAVDLGDPALENLANWPVPDEPACAQNDLKDFARAGSRV